MTQEALLEAINEISEKYQMDTLESFVYLCESNDFDIEAMATIVPQSLKIRMERDAKQKRLLKKNADSEYTLPL
jgi:hypothetical protein